MPKHPLDALFIEAGRIEDEIADNEERAMPKITYGLIDAKARKTRLASFNDLFLALDAADLPRGKVDHGVAAPGIGIVVHEHSLYVPPSEQHYFAIGRKLYGGNAVLYATDAAGETRSLAKFPAIRFFANQQEVETAIDMGADASYKGGIDQPSVSVDGQLMWVWPQPMPTSAADKGEEPDDPKPED